jgi:hypothetical protein
VDELSLDERDAMEDMAESKEDVTLVLDFNTDVEVADVGCCMMAESVEIMAGEDAVDRKEELTELDVRFTALDA